MMKYLILLIALLTASPAWAGPEMLHQGAGTSLVNPSLVVNGYLETGDVTGWSGSNVTVNNGNPFMGSYSFYGSVTSTQILAWQSITVVPGTTYRLSALFNVTARSTGSVGIDFFNNSCSTDTADVGPSAVTNGYAYYSYDLTIPAGCTIIQVRVLSAPTSTLTAYIDNIELREIP